MPNIDNEEFKTIYRPPYSVDASACTKMLKQILRRQEGWRDSRCGGFDGAI